MRLFFNWKCWFCNFPKGNFSPRISFCVKLQIFFKFSLERRNHVFYWSIKVYTVLLNGFTHFLPLARYSECSFYLNSILSTPTLGIDFDLQDTLKCRLKFSRQKYKSTFHHFWCGKNILGQFQCASTIECNHLHCFISFKSIL